VLPAARRRQSSALEGAILADEVGLGKTIEAGILLAQRWAERRRRLLVICPANLRKQWSQELADKFFLSTAILEAKTFNEAVRNGNLNPFEQSKIIVCSYQFARAKEPYLRQTTWDLVVIDEAHRLRNVYKPTNKIGNAIKNGLANRQKVLLTATPLQNSLQELYGLVSIVDEFTFGDLRSFRAQFGRVSDNAGYATLKDRLRPICQRTLRKQVLPYVSSTQRHAIVQEFVPSDEEQRLYDLVSEYLQRPNLYALPASQRQLMTLMLRKLLASSTYAISDTLAGLASKLEAAEQDSATMNMLPEFAENFELLPGLEDEWAEDDQDSEEPATTGKMPVVLPEQREERRQEIGQWRRFHDLARSIQRNSKGEQLLTALKRGFAAAKKAQAAQSGTLQQKAIIFTESRRTQEYLLRLLQQTQFAGRVVLFNGSNTDEGSQQIYREWLALHQGTDRITGSPTADKRAALVEYFRDDASIMIATEAAAEGINPQFCNLVVNFDLPWNPQRIEQRIGRCHRYGQKFDVVVVNFLNKANAADVRVYQLLAEKFQLFDGVFGASDEVLGAIESGVDFEKRIIGIYRQCRTMEQISLQFNQLQQELEGEIGEARSEARDQLLNNFDHEVIERVRVSSTDALTRFDDLLWRTTRFALPAPPKPANGAPAQRPLPIGEVAYALLHLSPSRSGSCA
jgi:SNF2 family DNA or RNA helicase